MAGVDNAQAKVAEVEEKKQGDDNLSKKQSPKRPQAESNIKKVTFRELVIVDSESGSEYESEYDVENEKEDKVEHKSRV